MATPLDTVTIVLSGEVSLADFAKAITHFDALIKSLSAESQGQEVDWVIQDLEISSTVATAKGVGDRETVERVVRDYADVGSALQQQRPIEHSQSVQKAARALRKIANGKIDSVRFETAEREVIIRSQKVMDSQLTMKGEVQAEKMPSGTAVPTGAYGSIDGRVQTLTNRGGLRFTLYDLFYDKAVSCYLQEGYEGIMRDAWGKLAVVSGLVTRDPFSGRPLSIRQVSAVEVKHEESGDYRDARGVSPPLTDMSPEEAIKKVRDA